MPRMKQRHLLHEIETFLAETGMGESYFGKIAVGGSELVSRLRAGKDVHTKTARKARVFMRYYRLYGQTPERLRKRLRQSKGVKGTSRTGGQACEQTL